MLWLFPKETYSEYEAGDMQGVLYIVGQTMAHTMDAPMVNRGMLHGATHGKTCSVEWTMVLYSACVHDVYHCTWHLRDSLSRHWRTMETPWFIPGCPTMLASTFRRWVHRIFFPCFHGKGHGMCHGWRHGTCILAHSVKRNRPWGMPPGVMSMVAP